VNTSTEKSYTYEWYVVSVCMLAYVFSFIDRQILALLVEPVKQDLQLTDFQFSLLHGLAFSIFYAVMGLPIARLSDRHSRPVIIAIGVFVWSFATAACGISKNFLHMFLARIGVGVGEAALSPATYSMLADYFPKDKLGRAVGVYSIGSFIGVGLAFLIGGFVISLVSDLESVAIPVFGEVRPWQLTFFIVGLPGILISLLFWFTVKDPERKNLKLDENGDIKVVSIKEVFGFLNQHRKTFFFHYGGFSFYAMAMFSILAWAPAYYMRNFDLTSPQVGYILGTIALTTMTTGVYCGGWLSDHLLKKGYVDAPMRAGFIGAIGLLIPIGLFPIMESLELSLALLVVTMFFVSFPMPTSTAAMQMLAPNQMRAQISAGFLFISNLIGLTVGSALVAFFTDKVFGDEIMVGKSLAIVGFGATILIIILLGLGCRSFRESMESLEN
jgi:MFS family permease